MESKQVNVNFELIRKKVSLERQLGLTTIQLKKIQENCDHIKVTIGYFGDYMNNDTVITECLLCGKNDPCAHFARSIDASDYQSVLYGNGSSIEDGNARIEKIRKIWEELDQQDENLSEEEKINQIKEVINLDVEKTRMLEKKYNRKFK